jgi:hypothetical protein
LWLYALVGLVVLFLIAPSLLVVPLSFSDSRYLTFPPPALVDALVHTYFGAIEWREATYVSFMAAILTMLPLDHIWHACRLRFACPAQPLVGPCLCRLYPASW